MDTILIADDHEMIRYGIRSMIDSFSRTYRFIEATSCTEVVQLLSRGSVQYAILDMNLSDGNFFSSMDAITAYCNQTHILVYSMNAEKIYARRLIQKGIKAFVNKQAGMHELEKAIQALLQGETYAGQEWNEQVSVRTRTGVMENPLEALSDRELQVAEYITTGMGTKEIAWRMALDVTTVNTYRKRAFDKLDVQNRMELKDIFLVYKMKG